MPEGVPREAKKTIQNAVQLSQVGMLLAEKDYAGFPDIAKEITDASKDTIEATALLSNSIDAMSDSDRKVSFIFTHNIYIQILNSLIKIERLGGNITIM